MSGVASLIAGIADALCHPKLVLSLWSWQLIVGAAAALPMWYWLAGATAALPEADRLLDRFVVSVAVELVQYDRTSALGGVTAAALGILALSILIAPLLAGGVLEVLVSRDDRPFLHRFFRGGGHFYGRFLRLAIGGWIAAGVGAALAAFVAGALVDLVAPDASARPLAAALAPLAVGAIVGVWLLAVLDLARIQIAITDRRGTLRAWLAALGLALRQVAPLAIVWIGAGIALVALLVAYVRLGEIARANTWTLIAASFATQQAFVLARLGIRVSLVAGELHLYRRAVPPPAPEPLPDRAPPPAAEPDEPLAGRTLPD